jgi:hypothetical protein
LRDDEKDLKSYRPGASHARRASFKVRDDLGTGSVSMKLNPGFRPGLGMN